MNKKLLDLPLSYKIVLATLLLLMAGAVALLMLGARAVAPVAAVEMQKNTAAVGRALSNQFAMAVAAGIPMDRLNGVRDLLTEVLEDNPTLRGIELLTADGRRLIQAGAPLPSRDTSGQDWQGGSVTSSPIQVGQQIVGTVRVGGDARFVEHEILVLLGAIVALFVAGTLAMVELTRLICRRAIDEPVSRLQSMFRQVLAGHLPQPEPLTGTGAFAQANRRFQQLLRHVQDRFDHIAASARAIRGLDLDAVSGARLSELLEQVNANLRPVRDSRPSVSVSSPVWLLFFALILAELPRGLMPGLMMERMTSNWRDLLPALPLLGWAGGMMIGLLIANRVSQAAGRRFLLGCAALAAGFALLLLLPAPAGMVIARLLAGLGVGVIWTAVGATATIPGLRLAGLLVGGDLVGPILGNALVESLGWPWLVAVGFGGVLILAPLGYRTLATAPGLTPLLTRPNRTLGASALVVGGVSAAMLQVWVPLHLNDHGLVMIAYAIVGAMILLGAGHRMPILAGWLSALSGAAILLLAPVALWSGLVGLPLLGLGLGRLYRTGDGNIGSWLVGWSVGLLAGAGLVMVALWSAGLSRILG